MELTKDEMFNYKGLGVYYNPENGRYYLYDQLIGGAIGVLSLVEGLGWVFGAFRGGLEWGDILSIQELMSDLNDVLDYER